MDHRVEIPTKLPVILLSDGLVFPGVTARFSVHSAQNVRVIERCVKVASSLREAIIAVAFKNTIQNSNFDTNKTTLNDDIHPIAVAALVTQIVESSDMELNEQEYADFLTNFERLLQFFDTDARIQNIRALIKQAPPAVVTDMCAAMLSRHLNMEQKFTILDTVKPSDRVSLLLPLIDERLKILSTEENSEKPTRGEVSVVPDAPKLDDLVKSFGGFIGEPRIKRIPISGGLPNFSNRENGDQNGDSSKLLKRLRSAKMPSEVEKQILSDFEKYRKMPSFSPEHSSLRNYLEFIADLPWSKETTDILDIAKARVTLESGHYGLDEVKKRVLEHLAVCQRRQSLRGPILCFVGPPGVGKTSIAQAIAQALGRKFQRMSLGGISDQSDIRGHRRTYVGAMAGRVMQAIKLAGTRNPVILLDEIDKLYAGLHGDPAAALLEALDPAQNSTFVDHYVNAPFDLSRILFIATANEVGTIPAALLDRMETIHVPGYTIDEKIHIAQGHLVSQVRAEHGLDQGDLVITEEAIREIVLRYTREAGVRSLQRRLAAVCRAVALRITSLEQESRSTAVENDAGTLLPPSRPVVIDCHALANILGEPLPSISASVRPHQVSGITLGLAWTPHGGELLYVEASKWPGKGRLTLTGKLGDVMKESAELSLAWLKANVDKLRCMFPDAALSSDSMSSFDVHVHLPGGAIAKDGPSAGLPLVVALVSLFADRPVNGLVAMSGEVTLGGLVLPVGGVKAKLLAAHSAGVNCVLLPVGNRMDLAQLPENVKESMEFVFVETVEEAIRAVFEHSESVQVQSKL